MVEVSFVLAIYNAERTLAECLNSILVQNHRNFEIIVVDGGSTDATLAIIEEFIARGAPIKLIHNPRKLSEGKGMSKDLGERASQGKYVIFLDHDNILEGSDWTSALIAPFKKDSTIMASQSMLAYNSRDPIFLKYINSLGVEDPFAIDNSLVAQVTLHPEHFEYEDNYYCYDLDERKVLFAGSNGCAFRKEVFIIVGGYTREVDVFAIMAHHKMRVAVVMNARVNHKTSSNFLNFMIKKGKYFTGFFKSGYKYRKYRWVDKGLRGKIEFALKIAYNLSIVGPFVLGVRQAVRTGKLFWLLHPLYVFFITAEYVLIGILNVRTFMRYAR